MTRAEWRMEVIERDRAERCGEVHHILGRAKPRGWRDLPEPLRGAWPDVPMNGIVLTVEEHRPCSHVVGREAKRRLLQRLLDDYGDRVWEGHTYREWLTAPPFQEFLMEEEI